MRKEGESNSGIEIKTKHRIGRTRKQKHQATAIGHIHSGTIMTEVAPSGLVETYRRTEPKIGRNDPCPCGSGKKYKHCCLRKKAQAEP
jgi:uncharacterized protein YecA (UPF0149 family)